MPTIESMQAASEPEETTPSFEPAVAEVLQSLRQAIAATLAGVGDFGKPADIFKTLQLDRTLARQLFRLASTAEPVGNGGMIPSRTSIDRFLTAARSRGAIDRNVSQVLEAYGAFERLVQTHAGDRVTFNSMVSAAGGIDEDWLAADIQHRRNAFRAMSHALGVQSKTRLTTFIVNGVRGGPTFDVVVLGGIIGLRMLRALPSVRVHGTVGDSPHDMTKVTCRPIGISDHAGGYLLERFSSSPLPTLRCGPGDSDSGFSREVVIEKPVVGNVGSATLMFGTVFGRMPLQPDEPLRLHTSVNQPTEKLLVDVLIHPGLAGNLTPTGSASIGFKLAGKGEFGPGSADLQGHFDPVYLGIGPGMLATPEVAGYQDMLTAVAVKQGWDISRYAAWRIRVEFPLFQSTVTFTSTGSTDVASSL